MDTNVALLYLFASFTLIVLQPVFVIFVVDTAVWLSLVKSDVPLVVVKFKVLMYFIKTAGAFFSSKPLRSCSSLRLLGR